MSESNRSSSDDHGDDETEQEDDPLETLRQLRVVLEVIVLLREVTKLML